MALRADDVDLGRDRDLVARYQNGDPEAFDDLYRRYFDRLRRFCERHTSDAHEAEEVAQEAFERALRSMHTLRGERRFYPWMTVIARRLLIDRHRKMARVELTDEPDTGSVEPDIDHLFAEVDAAHVREALDNLGPRHREVLLLREGGSMSYADIAQTLEVPVTTIEALLHRARKALRREYAAVGGESRSIWALPLFAGIASRWGALRTRVDGRWIEIGAIATPVAVGAATAALVLVPAPNDAPVVTEATLPPTTAAVVDDVPTPPSTTEPFVVTTFDTPLSIPPSGTTPAAVPADPALDAGPVDVYVGPEATAEVEQKAEDMPVTADLGNTTGGVDPPVVSDDLELFLTDTVGIIFGGQK